MKTSSHSLLSIFSANNIDRIFQVPGESYIGILDALNDFPSIDVVTCRHESGAGFMACADGRLTGRPGVFMVSRGPGATNASIAIHTAQQDAIPLILIIGQVPKKNLRRDAFQEIEYQKMFGSIAKWVAEATDPCQLAEIAFKAIRIATSGTPGPVVIVIPEDLQQQPASISNWQAHQVAPTTTDARTLAEIKLLLKNAERPLIIAGGGFDRPQGRETLLALAEAWHVPVAVSFRRHDIFPNKHPLYIGDLGLSNPERKLEALRSSDAIFAIGTRLDDITSQGYTFPRLPQPDQTLVHCYPDHNVIGRHFSPNIGLACNPVSLARDLLPGTHHPVSGRRLGWSRKLRNIFDEFAAFAQQTEDDGVPFSNVVRALNEYAPSNAIICLDAGTFAAPVYRHFPFTYPQRLMAPLSGAMGYGTPAAVAAQLRHPEAKVICIVGDGGFMMTGNEMIAAAEKRLPILFIVSNNNSFGSIRIHQDINYPQRHLGTSLHNPSFNEIARSFAIKSELLARCDEVNGAIARGIAARDPYLIEIHTSLNAVLPSPSINKSTRGSQPALTQE